MVLIGIDELAICSVPEAENGVSVENHDLVARRGAEIEVENARAAERKRTERERADGADAPRIEGAADEDAAADGADAREHAPIGPTVTAEAVLVEPLTVGMPPPTLVARPAYVFVPAKVVLPAAITAAIVPVPGPDGGDSTMLPAPLKVSVCVPRCARGDVARRW